MFIKSFIPTVATPFNQYDNVKNKHPDLYTLSDNDFSLFQLDLLLSYTDSTEEDDTYLISSVQRGDVIRFWSTADNENLALLELANRFVSFIDTINEYADTEILSAINTDNILECPDEHLKACQAWINSVNPEYAVISGDISDAFDKIVELQYKFRKHCELIKNITNYVPLEIAYRDFSKMVKGAK